jgi:predicted unusual protein kinase regulating ubiquinone biosynthesis (AarF/ABC1/UbiB family)
MTPSVGELLQAFPEDAEIAEPISLPNTLAAVSRRSLPVGRWQRLRLLATLQAKIGAAYLMYWLRGWFQNADQKQRLLAETHWRTALRLLDSMGYMRGAVMKVGQTLANFPDIVPHQFVETLDRLYFDAPPMHWPLICEMVRNELGNDPENIFASFDKRAFAAASLGQVHRARLKTGEEVAVKIQYPGIASTIREDFRNLFFFMLPGRLSKDWQNMKDQLEDLRARLERETDYSAEAGVQQKVRSLFREDDEIVVPRVYPQHSTTRVLTMDRLGGVHLQEYLARNPSQEERDEFARKIVRAWYRMQYAGRLLYADFHPGNFLFMDDGRLGVIDFGFMLPLVDELWPVMRDMDRAFTTGQREDLTAAVKEWSGACALVTAADDSILGTKPISVAASTCSARRSGSAIPRVGPALPSSCANTWAGGRSSIVSRPRSTSVPLPRKKSKPPAGIGATMRNRKTAFARNHGGWRDPCLPISPEEN